MGCFAVCGRRTKALPLETASFTKLEQTFDELRITYSLSLVFVNFDDHFRKLLI